MEESKQIELKEVKRTPKTNDKWRSLSDAIIKTP